MDVNFNKISPYEIKENIFKLIANDWTLITAGPIGSYNMMTACWGAFGELWGRKVAICFIRHQRYTYEFVEREKYFTLTFFGEECREALKFCGYNSGRKYDKAKETGLTPFEIEPGIVSFAQAKLIIVCKKLYGQDQCSGNYTDADSQIPIPKDGPHKMYIGEITACYEKA